MAFNWQTFRTRSLTAMVFVAVMLCGLLVSNWTFFLLFSIIHAGCWLEYQKLVGKFEPSYSTLTPLHAWGVILAGWGMLMYASMGSVMVGNFSVSELGFWLCLSGLFGLPVIELLFSRKLEGRNIAWSALGLLYISLSLALLMHLRSGDIWRPADGRENLFTALGASMAGLAGYVMPLVIIASIWINDTMAYIVGSLIGRTPLSSISPKKTWEGTIGGIILSIVTVTLIGVYALHGEARDFVAISAISSIAGTVGDLIESKLKRVAGVKDSGRIMPGHGGFLDRFDSLLVAVPFVWIYARFFMH
jgi:phosphatidate cytidylyltransferase